MAMDARMDKHRCEEDGRSISHRPSISTSPQQGSYSLQTSSLCSDHSRPLSPGVVIGANDLERLVELRTLLRAGTPCSETSLPGNTAAELMID